MARSRVRFLHPRSRSQSGQRSKSCLSNNSKTTEANLTKLHRKLEHNQKVCCATKLDSCAQGQGHNQTKGQIVPIIVLLINYGSKFNQTSQKNKAICESVSCTRFRYLAQGQGRNQVRGQNRVSAITQKLPNLTKLHRKIEYNEKVCSARELGSYAQGQGHNSVRGQFVPKIVLLINY